MTNSSQTHVRARCRDATAAARDVRMTSPNERAIIFDCAASQCLGIVHDAASVSPARRGADRGRRAAVSSGQSSPVRAVGASPGGQGHPVFRFDYRGMGDSAGEGRDFRAVTMDIRSAIDAFTGAVPGLRSVVIFGLCDAASAALMYCNSDDRVAGLILVNPWVRTDAGLARAHVKHYYRERLLHGSFWRKLTSGRLQLLPAAANFLRSVGLALRGQSETADSGPAVDFVTEMRHGLEEFALPVLCLMSGRDLTAREFSDLWARDSGWARSIGRSNVSIRHMVEADHTFSSRTSTEWANNTCAEWIAVSLLADRR